MATFFRVCHRSTTAAEGYHVGPYSANVTPALSSAIRAYCWGGDRHPGVKEDLVLTRRELSPRVCGFVTLEALYAWFGAVVDELDRAGFVIRAFKVHGNAIRTGTYQSVCKIDRILEAPSEILEWRKP